MMTGRGRGKRIRRNDAQWRAMLSRFSTSGLSVSAFCEREAVSTASFYRWRGLLEQHDNGKGVGVENKSAFVDLGTLGTPPIAPNAVATPFDLHLDLGGGLSLHLVRR